MEESKPKVILILEDSERTDWGVVKDCHGSMPEDMSKCEIIGTWSTYGDGTFFVELTTSVEAQQDVLIGLIKERAEARRLEWGNSPPPPGRMPQPEKWDPSQPYYPTTEELAAYSATKRTRAPSRATTDMKIEKEITKEFGSLRDKLRRK